MCSSDLHLSEAIQVTKPIRDCAEERALLGLDHTEAGALICAKWNLPIELQDLIKDHHELALSGGEVGPNAPVLRLADALAHEAKHGYLPGAAPSAVVDQRDLLLLGISLGSWHRMREELIASMAMAIPVLGSVAD